MFRTARTLFRKNIIYKLTIANSFFIFLAFILIGVVISLVNHSTVMAREKQVSEIYLRNVLNAVDNKIKDMARVSLIAFSDTATQDILQNISSYANEEKLSSLAYLQNLYTNLVTLRNDIRGIYLFNEGQLVFYQNSFNYTIKTNYDMIEFINWMKTLEVEPAYGRANYRMTISGWPVFLWHSSALNPLEDNFIYILREVKKFSPNERIGHILLMSPLSVLKDAMTEFSGVQFSYLLISESGVVMYSDTVSNTGRRIDDLIPALYDGESGNFKGHYAGKKSMISWRKSFYSGITLLTATPLVYLYQNTFLFIGILGTIFLAVVTFIILLTGKITKLIIQPIHLLSTTMENFTIENTGQQLPVTSEDEAGRLTEAFNAMSKTIHELIITEYENTIKLKTMQLRQKEAQLENLRNQINPHFLYNTLDNIRIKAALGGDKETAEMIMLLVEFFRGNMEVTTLTPIAHEIKLIRIYLALMRYRYPDLEAVFEIDEDLQSIEMPGFILQPIVENSLLHGLKSVNYRGRIIISLAADKAREDLLILTVADNGKGLDTEARRNLAGILNGSETNKESGDMHIGILNVQQRLRMFYSEGCGLFFQDNPEGGVRVVIKIKKNALPISDSIML